MDIYPNKFTYLNTFMIVLAHRCSDNGGPTVLILCCTKPFVHPHKYFFNENFKKPKSQKFVCKTVNRPKIILFMSIWFRILCEYLNQTIQIKQCGSNVSRIVPL